MQHAAIRFPHGFRRDFHSDHPRVTAIFAPAAQLKSSPAAPLAVLAQPAFRVAAQFFWQVAVYALH